MPDANLPRVRAVTVPVDDVSVSLEWASERAPLVWQRGEEMLIGIGELVRIDFAGPDRFADAARNWQALCSAAEVVNELDVPGTGLVAFGSASFAEASGAGSMLRVPQIVLGRRDGQSFRTDLSLLDVPGPSAPLRRALGDFGPVVWADTADAAGHTRAVRGALDAISAGRISKVVLARRAEGTLPAGSDLRTAVSRLSSRNPDAWVFAIDGLIGASPETLLAATGTTGSIRVLAGTRDRGNGTAADLLTSTKDRFEHEIAVESVLSALERAGVRSIDRGEPFALQLPELWHLASDLRFDLDTVQLLRVLGELHPTGAVGGTPTAAALELITELESSDRGRYAGPVGWLDANGGGEWAIALRCAQVDGTRVVAWAGGGIVAGSEPEREFDETELKLRTIRSAL
ncbi:MAG TPA: chorismate-binding protein [Microbacteriaceae bacterium]|nr:chorismate-binding protein [Microbacteriaceae bacterium]